ncbi:hypothetical protein G9C85_13245 [Halorubellus sp. JP-L1]|uniref:DUF7346 family protein n=1 Tax=Halorubellus sp. JP-L1 TaxID=2715753 RepID=UPI0014099448|nr:hypothetical protein [Halorubellus sp. JP-L1]NHN42586.1 hypothetical protein [Halorubellus sp. JP-L1]
MRTVETPDGNHVLVRKASGDSLLVADPDTGEERYVDRDAVSELDGESALAVAASAVPAPTRRVLTAVHDDESVGLLLELVDRGPLAARTLLDEYDYCESDLYGLVAEFRAAGLVEEATVAGERGYDATELARDGVAVLRGAN